MRTALIVGIDYYEHADLLYGCVDDARAVQAALERHGDGTRNFECKMLLADGPANSVNRKTLRDHVTKLFQGDPEIALFYFAGHGHIEATGGYLLGSDAERGDEGLSLTEILTMVNPSPPKKNNRLVVLDSCHSGIAGAPPARGDLAALSEGLTILTASTANQYATEANGRGLFTTLLVDALSGGAANLTGDITPGSVYAYIDQSLGSWEGQRPVFKTNVQEFVSLRRVRPPIELNKLLKITEFFPGPGYVFPLDPTYEPEAKGRDPDMPAPILENTAKFAILQEYNRLNLLVPVDAPHMWHAAMWSKGCKLTVLGEHYRRLVEKKRV
jgi:hypothetical protein